MCSIVHLWMCYCCVVCSIKQCRGCCYERKKSTKACVLFLVIFSSMEKDFYLTMPIFMLLGIIWLINAVDMVLQTGWLFYVFIAIAVITGRIRKSTYRWRSWYTRQVCHLPVGSFQIQACNEFIVFEKRILTDRPSQSDCPCGIPTFIFGKNRRSIGFVSGKKVISGRKA